MQSDRDIGYAHRKSAKAVKSAAQSEQAFVPVFSVLPLPYIKQNFYFV